MNGRNDARSILLFMLVGLLIGSAAGCRSVGAEAGLDQEIFEESDGWIGFDPHGYWFAVAPTAGPDGSVDSAPYVVIEYDGQRELFYASPRGERAVQLLPLTPVDSAWFNEAQEKGVKPQFIRQIANAQLSDAVGIWDGSGAVTWSGPAPSGPVKAVAVTAKPPEAAQAFFRSARGVVTVDGAKVTSVDGDIDSSGASANYLLLPDGPAADRRPLNVVNLSDAPVEAGDTKNITIETKAGPTFNRRSLAIYTTEPAGRNLGADLLVVALSDGLYVVNVGSDHARLGGAALVAAVANTPMRLARARDFSSVAQGYRALRHDHPLVAAYWFGAGRISPPDSPAGGTLRLAELPGASGRTQWSRVALMAGAAGPTADRMLYLARAHLLEGDNAQASSYAMRAADKFRSWRQPTRQTGQARAQLVAGRAEFVQNHPKAAVEVAGMAEKQFKTAGDTLRRADAEMALADYLYAANRLDDAIETAKLARSRFYHGGTPYFSGLAEIRLAELLLEAGQADDAAEMAGFAVARLKKLDEPIGQMRATIVKLLADKASGKASTIAGELKNELARAHQLDDPVAQTLAAAGLINAAGIDAPKELVELGTTLVRTRNKVDDAVAQRYRQRAMTAMCGQGLATTTDAGAPAELASLEGACASAVSEVSGDVETLRGWLDRGFVALQKEEFDRAQSTAEQLTSSLDDDLEQSWPVVAAEIQFFRYALASTPALTSAPSVESASAEADQALADQSVIDAGLSLLNQGIDPAKQAAKLTELARHYRDRGITTVAGKLGERAMKAARSSGQKDRQRQALFFVLETYQQAGQPADVLRVARAGAEIAAQAGPGSEALKSRVILYQSDAEFRLGRTSDAELHRSTALGALKSAKGRGRLDLLGLAAQLDLGRHALKAAKTSIDAGRKIANALSPEQRNSAEMSATLARLYTLDGQRMLRVGHINQARSALAEATDAADNSDRSAARAWQARALSLRAGLAADAADAQTYQRELEELVASSADVDDTADAIVAARSLLEYDLMAGRASAALDVAERVHDKGWALAGRRQEVCMMGRAALFAGRSDQANRQLRTCEALHPNSARGAFAGLLAAMNDDTSGVAARAKQASSIQKRLGDQLGDLDAGRLQLIKQLARPETSFDKARAQQLRKTADKTGTAADVAAYASYLLSTGQVAEASAYVDQNSTTFFKRGAESPGTLIRLRLEALIRNLEPVEAALYAERALSEARSVDDAERRRIYLVLAKNAAVAGQWWRAIAWTRQARQGASSTLGAQIDAFAQAFPVISSSSSRPETRAESRPR